MAARAFLPIEQLPHRSATYAKNQWGDLVRQVRAAGGVAVTNHDTAEMVVVDASRYQEMVAIVENLQGRHRATLAELSAEFDERLAALKAPDARERVEAAIESRGRVSPRPKAGISF